jgi:hypothetical protein
MVILRFLSGVFHAFPPPPPLLLFALNLPCTLVAAADALSGMVDSDLLFLLLRPRPALQDGCHCPFPLRISIDFALLLPPPPPFLGCQQSMVYKVRLHHLAVHHEGVLPSDMINLVRFLLWYD